MFAPTEGVGTQNLLANVWNSIASNDNMEFTGMTQELNGYKNLVWDTKVNLPNGLRRLKKLDVSTPTVIDRALEHMEKKLGYLERIRLGVYMTNLPDNQRLIDITNNRVHAGMKQLDTNLREQNPKIKPFNEQGGWFFTRLFETYQNALLDDVSTGVKPRVVASARDMILHIREIWPDLDSRQSELNDEPLKKKWKSIETRWNYYMALPASTWLIDIAWSWGCGTVTRRANGDSCPLIPPLSTANATSIEATTTTPPTSQPTAAPTGPLITTTRPSSSTMTANPVPTCHMDADCQRSAYTGICRYVEAIKCQDGKCMCGANPPPVSNTTAGTSPPITTTQSVGPTISMPYATGTCTAYMAEIASIEGYMADVILYDDNEMEIGRSPNLPNTWRPAAWGSNITIKDSKLTNAMSIEFLEAVLDKRSITTPANSRQREAPSNGQGIKRQIPAFSFWDIVFTLGDQNWSTKDSDDQKLPFCDVRDWTYASDNVLVSIPFPIPDDPWLSVRLLGCRWKC